MARPILALDGCALECTRSSLAERGVQPSVHLLLNEQGVKKRYATDFDPEEAERVFAQPCAACVGKPPQGRRTERRTERPTKRPTERRTEATARDRPITAIVPWSR